jgi:hypothetical protein
MHQEDQAAQIEDSDISTLTEALQWTRLEPPVFPEWADVNFKTPPLPLRAGQQAQVVNGDNQPSFEETPQPSPIATAQATIIDDPVMTDTSPPNIDMVTARKRKRFGDQTITDMRDLHGEVKKQRLDVLADIDRVVKRTKKRTGDHLTNALEAERLKIKRQRTEAT